jgi:hypothetical protein
MLFLPWGVEWCRDARALYSVFAARRHAIPLPTVMDSGSEIAIRVIGNTVYVSISGWSALARGAVGRESIFVFREARTGGVPGR